VKRAIKLSQEQNDESIEKVLEIADKFLPDHVQIDEAIKGLNRLEIAALTQVICSRMEVEIIRRYRTLQQKAELAEKPKC
jgi:hypothetical protein